VSHPRKGEDGGLYTEVVSMVLVNTQNSKFWGIYIA